MSDEPPFKRCKPLEKVPCFDPVTLLSTFTQLPTCVVGVILEYYPTLPTVDIKHRYESVCILPPHLPSGTLRLNRVWPTSTSESNASYSDIWWLIDYRKCTALRYQFNTSYCFNCHMCRKVFKCQCSFLFTDPLKVSCTPHGLVTVSSTKSQKFIWLQFYLV